MKKKKTKTTMNVSRIRINSTSTTTGSSSTQHPPTRKNIMKVSNNNNNNNNNNSKQTNRRISNRNNTNNTNNSTNDDGYTLFTSGWGGFCPIGSSLPSEESCLSAAKTIFQNQQQINTSATHLNLMELSLSTDNQNWKYAPCGCYIWKASSVMYTPFNETSGKGGFHGREGFINCSPVDYAQLICTNNNDLGENVNICNEEDNANNDNSNNDNAKNDNAKNDNAKNDNTINKTDTLHPLDLATNNDIDWIGYKLLRFRQNPSLCLVADTMIRNGDTFPSDFDHTSSILPLTIRKCQDYEFLKVDEFGTRWYYDYDKGKINNKIIGGGYFYINRSTNNNTTLFNDTDYSNIAIDNDIDYGNIDYSNIDIDHKKVVMTAQCEFDHAWYFTQDGRFQIVNMRENETSITASCPANMYLSVEGCDVVENAVITISPWKNDCGQEFMVGTAVSYSKWNVVQ